MNELTRKKISAKMKGRKKTATHIKHIKQALTGRKLSKEHKENISSGMKEKSRNKKRSLLY